MKLAILTQYYPPEIGAPQRRLSSLARHFIDAGHSVQVLTAMPNYPRGRVYDGYGGIVSEEEIGGVRVVRSFVYPTQRTDFLHRLASYFSFVLSSATVGTVKLQRPDFLMVESPPLFLGLAGRWLASAKRTRMIFNVSDLWPESAVRLGLVGEGSLAHRLSERLEGACYRAAWMVTGQSREIVQSVADRFPNVRTYHLSNGVDCDDFGADRATDEARATLGADGRCVALYAGLHGIAQGLPQLLGAASKVHDSGGLDLVFLGDGPVKVSLVKEAHERELENVRFLDPLPADALPPLLAASHILLVPLGLGIPGAVPSKLYEAMASGRPIILVAGGEPANIVRSCQAGLVVEPDDIEGLAAALCRLRDDPELRAELGRNGRRAAERYFDRREIALRFMAELEKSVRI